MAHAILGIGNLFMRMRCRCAPRTKFTAAKLTGARARELTQHTTNTYTACDMRTVAIEQPPPPPENALAMRSKCQHVVIVSVSGFVAPDGCCCCCCCQCCLVWCFVSRARPRYVWKCVRLECNVCRLARNIARVMYEHTRRNNKCAAPSGSEWKPSAVLGSTNIYGIAF